MGLLHVLSTTLSIYQPIYEHLLPHRGNYITPHLCRFLQFQTYKVKNTATFKGSKQTDVLNIK